MITCKLFQINLDRDSNHVAFEGLSRVHQPIDSSLYDAVYHNTLPEAKTLEDLYRIFNIDQPKDYRGRSMSVSDVICVYSSDNEELVPGFYYCDSIGFAAIDFDTEKTYNALSNTIKVLKVSPDKKPEVVMIGNGLSSLQKINGGCYIETFYPFDDEVCLICDEEGKLNGSKPNRGIVDDEGTLVDIIFGEFLVVGCESENFSSLSDESIQKYSELFKYPEKFYRINGEIKTIKITD